MTTSDGSITNTNSQPAPKPNDRPAVWDMVVQDMRYRDRFGFEKYGTRLQPLNGRDFLVDAYQEALDLVVYLRGAIYERDNTEADHARPAIPADFGQQNQLSGGPMLRCPDCIAEHCACIAS